MTTPAFQIPSQQMNFPKITFEFTSPDNVRAKFENFPAEMKLTAVNILANGAAIFIIEPVPSRIIKPVMQS